MKPSMGCSSANSKLGLRRCHDAERTAWYSGFVIWLMATALSAQSIQLTNAPSQMPPARPSEVTAAEADASTNNAPSAKAQGPDIYKTMSLQELMNQDVTSVSKEPEPLGQAPAAIQVITNDEIRRSGAASVPEALRLASNLEVAQGTSHDWHISARGFNTDLDNKLLVLIDGRAVYSPLDAGVFWDVQNVMLEDVDRIEVISGPGGTLWGANAVNGVINIITKSAEQTQGGYLDSGYGSDLRYFGDLRYGGKLAPNVYYRVYGSYFDRGSEDLPSGRPASDSWQQERGGFLIDTGGLPDDKLTLQGDYYSGAENVTSLSQSTTGQPVGAAYVSGGNVLGRWTHTLSADSDMSLQLYYDRTNFADPVPPLLFAQAGTLTDELDTYDLNFQHDFQAGDRNRIVWGLGYRFTHDEVRNAPALAFFPTTLNQNLFSGFVQDEIKLQKNLTFTMGTKVEHNDYTGFEVEPSGRLQWQVTPKQMLWAAISRAVRTPSRIDRDIDERTGISVVPSLLQGGTTFDSESLIAYELGYRGQLGDKTTVSISNFYNDYDNIRSASLSPPPALLGLPVVFENNLAGQTYGTEISATQQVLDWWSLRAGYDLLEEHLHVKSGQTDVNNAHNETADPEHQFSLHSSMDLPENIEFDTGLRWVDTLDTNNGAAVETVPSYFELDARLSWHITKDLELSLVGQNLLHDHHPEFGLPTTTTTTREEIVRSVYGKIAWHF
jgi:iron complex outermembrane recepter protein